mgnify:FL=1|tara:strand:+ start:1852 stop:2889 length:1038 start_codon:yes stop_codon:yes gene_type:complete
MKIMICSDGTNAHLYQRTAWVNALNAVGIQAALWDKNTIAAFDAFDQFEPDVFLGQSYNLDSPTLKCIYERPHMKVGLRAGDWGDHEQEVDKEKYNILFCSQKEKDILKQLKEETGKPDFVHIHYDDEAIKVTHNHFETIGIKPMSLMMCADTIAYSNSRLDPKLECDIGFVGGYWPYKGQVIDQYLMPMLEDMETYRIKIFGNQPWPANQYCGLIADQDVKNLFASAKICPNLSEPHAQKFGFDINERIFKILYTGGFCISDNVESYKMFGDGVVVADSPEDFRSKIDYYLNEPGERISVALKGHRHVTENHTGYHRVSQILRGLGLEKHASHILNKYKESLNG